MQNVNEEVTVATEAKEQPAHLMNADYPASDNEVENNADHSANLGTPSVKFHGTNDGQTDGDVANGEAQTAIAMGDETTAIAADNPATFTDPYVANMGNAAATDSASASVAEIAPAAVCAAELRAEATVSPVTVAAAPTTGARQKRSTNHNRDHVWPRHHALTLMALIIKVLRGDICPKASAGAMEVALNCLEMCNWLLSPRYLNLDDSPRVSTVGLRDYFFEWAINRVYYFSREGSTEHPRTRRNLRWVYNEFCRVFEKDVVTGTPISEERAAAFWLSVSYWVPFQAPLPGTGNDSSVITQGRVINGEVSND